MGNGFFSWFHLSNFMDTCQEWHAFVEGFGEGFCIWKSRYMPYNTGSEEDDLLAALMKEHHYYAAGRALGFAAFIWAVTGAVILTATAIIGALK
jgi:hypothetical protein